MRAGAALRRRQRSILPYALARCAEVLAGSAIAASTTIGFRHGGHVTATKLFEARQTIEDGGQELDVVINISKTRSGDWTYVHTELQALTKLIHSEGAKIKVIFEDAYLDDTEKIRLCEICGVIGLDWVKASTGYAASGAAIADLELMRRHSPANVQVKAAGDIRDLDALLAVREIGVSRVGATRTETMLEDCRKRLGLSPISHQTVSVSLTIVATRMVLTRIAIKAGTQATASSREEQPLR